MAFHDYQLTHTPCDQPENVVIIGAGQAGAQAAINLRQEGYLGEVTIIGEENFPPYQRPPLSKKYLLGDASANDLRLRSAEFYDKSNIDVRTSLSVTSIDRMRRQIRLGTGEIIQYGALLIATGASPRRLSCGEGIVRYIRTFADIDALRDVLRPEAKVVIIGGGYVGLELSAVASKLQCRVTILESAPHVLARVTGHQIAHYFEGLHASHGVTIKTSSIVTDVAAEGTSSAMVTCADGCQYKADIVVGAIGITANVDLARAAGLQCDDGILVDDDAKTSDEYIWAAGDCTRSFRSLFDRHVRLESVHNANEQARAAAASMLRHKRPPSQVPWFWSDQFDVKLQTAGLSQGHDQTVLWGSPSQSCFAVYYLKSGRLIAVDAVNAPAHMAFGRKRILNGDAFSLHEIPT